MKNILSFAFVFAAVMAVAEPAITKQAVRQRWPFGNKVDIDLYLDSDANSDVELAATWDGQATPVRLSEEQLEGSVNLRPGFNHLVWDPLAAGLGESKLTGFTVTATLASFDARKFLVIDLINRNYAYYAADPSGQGWSDIKYKRHFMVFRRVPAGTYRVGFTREQMDRLGVLGASQGYRANYDPVFAVRTVTITKDYYIGVHQVTGGQATHIGYYGTISGKGYYNGGTWCDVTNAYAAVASAFRGNPRVASQRCTWPQDGHDVVMPDLTFNEASGLWEGSSGSGSLVGRLRTLMTLKSTGLPANMVIDLPTQEQWEIAARAGHETLLADCGTLETTKEEILDYQEAHSTYQSGEVGVKLPNSWGLYDTAGLSYECVLNNVTWPEATQDYDDYRVTADASQTVDPVGFTCPADETLFAVTCNCGWSWHSIAYGAFPPNRRVVAPNASSQKCGARLCIHLK